MCFCVAVCVCDISIDTCICLVVFFCWGVFGSAVFLCVLSVSAVCV